MWEIDAGENVLFCGKVIKTKTAPHNNICTLTISYWNVGEGLEDYEDYFMTLSQILAIFTLGIWYSFNQTKTSFNMGT